MDFVKFVLIFFVIWGHTTAALRSTDMNWSDNYLTVLFTTFQMPLFILISGYLFNKSEQRQSYRVLVIKKLNSVLIPILVWNTLIYIPVSALALWQGWKSVIEVLGGYIPYLFQGLWYLWAYLLISVIICIINAIVKKESARIILYLVVVIVTHLGVGGFCHLDFMFPFFLLGYYLAKLESTIPLRKKYYIVGITGCLFLILLPMFRPEYSMYTLNEVFDIGNAVYFLKAYGIRFATGIAGCAFVCAVLYLIWYVLKNTKFIFGVSKIGTKTMELYILHTFFISYLMRWIIDGVDGHHYFASHLELTNFVFSPIIVVCMIAVGVVLTNIINSIPFVSKFVFGIKGAKLLGRR